LPKAAAKAGRRRRQRGSINAEEIIGGAFEVARRVSLDQLSMPALAEHLDVGVTSIYWYFRKKDDLLNAMTDVAVDAYIRQMPPVRDDQQWQDVLYNFCSNSRDTHRDDQILSDLILIRTSTYTPEATRRLFEVEEAIISRLVDAGFTTDNALMVFNAASVYTRGMIIHDRILRLSNTPTLDDRQRRITDWSAMPLLGSLIDRHPLAGTSDEDFEFGMARLLSGFEALLREQDIKAARRRPASRRVTAARPDQPSASTAARPGAGGRAAERGAARPGAAAEDTAGPAAASDAAAGPRAPTGRNRAAAGLPVPN
jgi:AcrR family transcriptional regulator